MRISEMKYLSDLLSVNKNNVKKTWQIMKNIINKNKNKMIYTKFKLSETDQAGVLFHEFLKLFFIYDIS